MANYYIGIDGGGSKTRYICLDQQGREMGCVVTGSTYVAQEGIDTVIERLRQGIYGVLPEKDSSVLIGFGMPAFGEDRALDKRAVEAIRSAFAPMKIFFYNDSAIGWAGSLAMEPGVSIVGGTGSIAYGVDPEGNHARCGGWHEFFSDEGSGYWLGKKLLQLFSQQSDGRREKTLLYSLVKEKLSLEEDLDITALASASYCSSRKETAALQTILLEAARAGDPDALQCYDEAAAELSRLILAVINQLHFPESYTVPVSYQGGLFSIEELIREPVARKVCSQATRKVHFHTPKLDPCRGAILLAMDSCEPEERKQMQAQL